MSFFNAIKRSFGFGEQIEDDGLLSDSIDAPVDPVIPQPEASEIKADEPVSPVELDPTMVERIFDHVVETFNKALPGFLSQSVDPEAQRKSLYEGLDSSLKDYLASVTEQTRRRCEAQWASEQSQMRSEMENLKSKAKEIEQQRFDIKQQQLSADRQRRALADRVHDLESQISAFEAEREQFDLENKSLVNKLKVAAVHESEAESLRNELNEAHATILAMRNEGLAENAPAPSADEAARIEALEKENAELREAVERAAEKDRISNEMFNGLQSKASAARSERDELEKEIADLKSRLAEAEIIRKEIAEINSQMTMVEKEIDSRDRMISKLKSSCNELREENTSLRDTIAANLAAYNETEEQLKMRIAVLEESEITPVVPADITADQPADYDTAAEPDADLTPKISDGDLAAIEESFDSADWMRSDPPQTPSMRTGVSEAEFGYQPPARKPNRPDNDAQLSLF